VAISATTLVVGAPGNGNNVGTAYVFTETGGAWKQVAALEGVARADAFGSSVAVSGTTAVVGADGAFPDGRAYVFTKTAGVWRQVADVKGSALGEIGESVAISGTTAIVSGTAAVLTKTGAVWKQVAELKPGGYSVAISSVAISGTNLVVGAPSEGEGAGAAYVFTETGGAWKQVAELKPPSRLAPTPSAPRWPSRTRPPSWVTRPRFRVAGRTCSRLKAPGGLSRSGRSRSSVSWCGRCGSYGSGCARSVHDRPKSRQPSGNARSTASMRSASERCRYLVVVAMLEWPIRRWTTWMSSPRRTRLVA
jgi:hypothetical protein